MDLKIIFFSGLLGLAVAVEKDFPPNFMFGAATSSYQIEGGWDADGKGESVWDNWVHNYPETIADESTGDVAADSYNKWEKDIEACLELGVQHYRLSISWPRVLPTGYSNNISEAGVAYYNKIINKLRENNIEPMVTMYHWDLPEKFQRLGGWSNPILVDLFASYADVLFSLFADRVKYWLTFNEPSVTCELSYSTFLAPEIDERVLGPFICNKNILLAHAKAFRIYEKKYKNKYNGLISLANNLVWFEPASKDMEEITELARQFLGGRYSHAIYSKEGGWPPVVEKFMAELSKKQGFNSSRLPMFTRREKNLIRGTFNFYGINYYSSSIVREALPGEDTGVWFISGSPDLNVVLDTDPTWQDDSDSGFPVYAPGLRKQLSWLKDKYGNVDVIITENGFSNSGSLLNDPKRIDFIYKHLEQILLSIKVDKVNVVGYTYWALIDNFEWMDGYTKKFGLFEIDFEDPELTRVPRESAKYYASIIENKTLIEPENYSVISDPDTYLDKIDNSLTLKTEDAVPN